MKSKIDIFKQLVFALSCLVLLAGCNDLEFNISFEKVLGLKNNDAVIFENAVIGKVKKVLYTKQGDFLVTVNIDKDFSNAATEHSKFYIDDSPAAEGDKSITVLLSRTDGTILKKGSTIKGHTRFAAKIPQVDEIEPFFNKLEEQINTLFRDFKNLPESNQFKDMKEKLKVLGEQFADTSKDLQEKIKKDILPKLKEEIDRLIKELEKQGEKNKAKSLEEEPKKPQSL